MAQETLKKEDIPSLVGWQILLAILAMFGTIILYIWGLPTTWEAANFRQWNWQATFFTIFYGIPIVGGLFHTLGDINRDNTISLDLG